MGISPKDSYAMLTAAEIENGKLRAEIDRLRGGEKYSLEIEGLVHRKQELEAEIERLTALAESNHEIIWELQAEIERLRALDAMDVDSKEAALWSKTMQLKSRNEWLEAEVERLTALVKDFSTRLASL